MLLLPSGVDIEAWTSPGQGLRSAFERLVAPQVLLCECRRCQKPGVMNHGFLHHRIMIADLARRTQVSICQSSLIELRATGKLQRPSPGSERLREWDCRYAWPEVAGLRGRVP